MWLQRNGKTCTSGLVMAGNWAKNVWKNEEKERGLQYGKEIWQKWIRPFVLPAVNVKMFVPKGQSACLKGCLRR